MTSQSMTSATYSSQPIIQQPTYNNQQQLLSFKNDAEFDTWLRSRLQQQNIPNLQPIANNKQANDKKDKYQTTLESTVYTLALKVYDEQLPCGWVGTCDLIKKIDSKYMQVLGIMHYLDTLGDSFWRPSTEKPHYHIILRMTKRKGRIRVKKALEMLGVAFRQGLDDNLLAEKACETAKHFSAYANYLTHETEQAILDGKARYPIENIVSNLELYEIEQIRDGYIRPSAKRKLTQEDLIALDTEAYNTGYELKDFDAWYNSLDFNVRSNAKMKVVKESYYRGIGAKIKEHIPIVRLCVFIQGPPNTGKTYATSHSIDGECLNVSGGGSGKFDNLKASHVGIIIDDDICPNLLTMSDNYICYAYRRNNNNSVWAGAYLIVTSNLSFLEWLEECHFKVFNIINSTKPYRWQDALQCGFLTEQAKALLSRFYICQLVVQPDGTNRLICDHVSTRGSADDQTIRRNMFVNFQWRFNNIIRAYIPRLNVVDYSQVNRY